jgi:hypothetical protein
MKQVKSTKTTCLVSASSRTRKIQSQRPTWIWESKIHYPVGRWRPTRRRHVDRWLPNADVSICDIMRNAACKRAPRTTTTVDAREDEHGNGAARRGAAWRGGGDGGCGDEGGKVRDERVIKSSEVNARRETLSDVGDRSPALLHVLLQPPPVAITHRTPNTIQSSKPHVRDPIPTRSQLFGSFKARSLAPPGTWREISAKLSKK